MSYDFARNQLFSARRYENGVHVSTVYWSVCQVSVPHERPQAMRAS